MIKKTFTNSFSSTLMFISSMMFLFLMYCSKGSPFIQLAETNAFLFLCAYLDNREGKLSFGRTIFYLILLQLFIISIFKVNMLI